MTDGVMGSCHNRIKNKTNKWKTNCGWKACEGSFAVRSIKRTAEVVDVWGRHLGRCADDVQKRNGR